MPENFSALARLAESTERIALALEKIANATATTHTEESKERQETQEKTTQKGAAGTTGEGGLSSFFRGFSEIYGEGKKAVNTVASTMESLTASRQAQAGLVAPADRIMSEVQQLSEAGQYLTDDEAGVYGAGVAQEQRAMQYNMKLLQQYVHRGTWNNIKDKWGTWKLDVDDDLSNYGTIGMIPRQSKKAWNDASIETISDYVKKHFRRNQGLDALGRD